MSDSECISCRKPKAILTCQICEESVCKKCAQRTDQSTFSFLPVVPDDLKHTTYCTACFDQVVAPEMESYQEIMERARGVFVFFKTQRKEVPLIRRAKEAFRIEECLDRDETILRLAFLAAREGYNAVIEVEVLAEKIRMGSYQTSKWSGTGVAAQIDGAKVDQQDLQNQMYR